MVEQSVLALEKQQGSNPVLSEGIHDWVFECHGFLHNAGLIIASFLFLLYLALQAKKSFLKLSHGRSYIIISYYASLWLVSILNLLWCFSQVNLFFPPISLIQQKLKIADSLVLMSQFSVHVWMIRNIQNRVKILACVILIKCSHVWFQPEEWIDFELKKLTLSWITKFIEFCC